MAIGLPGPHQRGVEVNGLITVKAEARSFLAGGVMGMDGIHQPPHVAHNGNGAVAHGIHLADATGLKAAGHQEGVTASIHQPGQFVAVDQVHRKTPRKPAGCFP